MLNLLKYHKQTPRYTSYPTAPNWEDLDSQSYTQALQKLGEDPISLYLHIPFCQSMCLFCACSVILNRNPENEERYVRYLCKEIELVSSCLSSRKKVSQVHFGGGTPTKLSKAQLSQIMECLRKHFDLSNISELAMEVDPRTVFADQGDKLAHLKNLGFNRISFGVQDTNSTVQEAVKRRQSYEMTKMTFECARKLNFSAINIDLIYGLPHQTQETFRQTVTEILDLRPDRIALFSYAKVPWLKEHQKAISDDSLPSTEEKFLIYENARKAFVDAGYVAIGMDHFALSSDELALSYHAKTLQRNFQGYTVKHAETLIGLGVTAIGNTPHLYTQNQKTLVSYYESLDANILPVSKGKTLSQEDFLRRWVIHTLMCQFELDKALFQKQFNHNFDAYFASLKAILCELEEEGLVQNTTQKLMATSLGELFIRNVVMHFDAYLTQVKPTYSYSI